jgi:predicted adenine nucleotide alpha hydrolase (AANH) superfamily ATPase
MTERGVVVKCLWFNPNIHPYMEYKNRLDALKRLHMLWNLDVEYIDDYGLVEYLRNVAGKEENRCEYCYKIRLEMTAKTAASQSFDAFTTSLLISPYQKFDMIIDIGMSAGKKYSVEFFMEDFRGWFRSSWDTGKQLGLYRQKYCGCIYSEMERYIKKQDKTS